MAEPLTDVPTEHVRDRLLHGARIAILLVAVTVQFGECLPQLLANRDDHDPWWPELVAFCLLALVAATAAVALVRRSVCGPRSRVLAVVCLLAGVLASVPVPVNLLLAADDWSFGLVGWYGLALLFDAPLRTIGTFLGAHLALTATEVLAKGVPPSIVTAAMAIAAVSVCGFQFAVALAAELFRRTAAAAEDASRREEEVRTREAIAENTHQDYQARYAMLQDSTAPLLTGLAQGTLDPDDEGTRRRCAIEAARMRQLFAESDDVADSLVHELRAGIDIAERHGVSVHLAVRGAVRDIPRRARHELVDAASVVLASARTRARATVVRGAETVRVSVVADAPAEAVRGLADPELIEITRTTDEERLWVEAVWPRTRSR
ncbi:hypothetical protein [Prauserella cavernicola]|uniref:Uncharacterized protein n=1 Tax=Prauserella cavernicola TaxID=2800127 RepID=A0A934QPC4_9PSEU|nr:hypothetical protein [Prauserella cavernicola]MBK1783274.1 hypothetical protein [Prauserella cavernicola]